jgi:cation transport regulator ChaC
MVGAATIVPALLRIPPTWNAELGVWVGDRAASTVVLPSPLWIFGYGSLCWKNGEILHTERFVGRAAGWRRVFAQRSMDHRGTPGQPGLVATMITEEQHALMLPEGGAWAAGDDGVCGVCYRIPEEHAAEVLDALDFREKGGYVRELVDVTPSDKTRATVRALLYTATPDNPNFFPFAVRDVEAAARIIARTTGPSGPNVDYLYALAQFLQTEGERDAHVEGLTEAVRRILAGEAVGGEAEFEARQGSNLYGGDAN